MDISFPLSWVNTKEQETEQAPRAFQAPAGIACASVALAKARHMARPRSGVGSCWGKIDAIQLDVLGDTCYGVIATREKEMDKKRSCLRAFRSERR